MSVWSSRKASWNILPWVWYHYQRHRIFAAACILKWEKNFTCKINLIILINKSNISQIVYYETSLLLFYQMTFDTIKLAMKCYLKIFIILLLRLIKINKLYVNKQFIYNLYFWYIDVSQPEILLCIVTRLRRGRISEWYPLNVRW